MFTFQSVSCILHLELPGELKNLRTSLEKLSW